jgi:DNA-binding MarR family transcriptional regulator
MVDRLVRQGLLTRIEDETDRRRKSVSISAAGAALLRKLERARTAEFKLALSCVSPELRA